MKLTNRKIVCAYKAVLSLADKPLPLPTAYALHKLRKALEPQWEFFCEEERKNIKQCGGTLGDDGKITFENGGKTAEFLEKETALSGMEVEMELKPVQIALSADLNISMNDLAALDGLVEVGE